MSLGIGRDREGDLAPLKDTYESPGLGGDHTGDAPRFGTVEFRDELDGPPDQTGGVPGLGRDASGD